MNNLILDARKISIDLRVEESKRVNEKYDTGNWKTNIHDLVKDSANMIDRLTAALMLSEETIRTIGKNTLSEEDLNKILEIIEATDHRMIEAYKDIK